MRDLIHRLNESSGSIALRESLLLWPVIEAAHVLSIMLFAGTILLVDLRLLGAVLPEVRLSEMTGRILPWTVVGLVLLIVTGALLFYAKPLVYFHNLFFRAKLLVIAAALVNVAVFHVRQHRCGPAWDAGGALPFGVRSMAVVSLSAWIAVIIAGRLVAYDWFDCPKLTPGSVMAGLASCPVGPGR